MAAQAFDDRCKGSNPRYPLIGTLKDLLIQAYHGHLPYKIFTNGKGQVTLGDLKLDLEWRAIAVRSILTAEPEQ